MSTHDDLLELSPGGAHASTCWENGLECQRVPVPGGVTLPLVVYREPGKAPLLVQVHGFPAQRCQRCGTEVADGPQAAACERDLAARLVRENDLPAEVDYLPSVAA